MAPDVHTVSFQTQSNDDSSHIATQAAYRMLDEALDVSSTNNPIAEALHDPVAQVLDDRIVRVLDDPIAEIPDDRPIDVSSNNLSENLESSTLSISTNPSHPLTTSKSSEKERSLLFETKPVCTVVDSPQRLSAVEAIVAKYLTPKQAAPPTKKTLLKRPYGVSVTDVDVYTENVLKKTKRTSATTAKKKPSADANGEKKKRRVSKKSTATTAAESADASSEKPVDDQPTFQPNTPFPPSYQPTTHHSSLSFQSSYQAPMNYLPHPHSTIHHQQYSQPYLPMSNNLQDQGFQSWRRQSSTGLFHELQNVPLPSPNGCGQCQRHTDLSNLGGHCPSCNSPICWTCWTANNCSCQYCHRCRPPFMGSYPMF